MFLSDLQTKDLISIKDGKRIGRIIDAEINEEIQEIDDSVWVICRMV